MHHNDMQYQCMLKVKTMRNSRMHRTENLEVM